MSFSVPQREKRGILQGLTLSESSSSLAGALKPSFKATEKNVLPKLKTSPNPL